MQVGVLEILQSGDEAITNSRSTGVQCAEVVNMAEDFTTYGEWCTGFVTQEGFDIPRNRVAETTQVRFGFVPGMRADAVQRASPATPERGRIPSVPILLMRCGYLRCRPRWARCGGR